MRLTVAKTLKLYVNGKFPRSESGRTIPATAADGGVIHVAYASRKDLRDAIGAARAAQPGWAGMTAYNRGQILYRTAEMMDGRATGFPASADAVAAASDRAVHHAGWADKVTQVLSTLNPIAGTYVNYSRIKPIGVVVAAPDPADGLLGLVEAISAATVMGNAVVVLADTANGELAVALAECLHTSDWPAGVVNVLTGPAKELIAAASKHDDVDALYLGGALADADRVAIDTEAARVLRRIVRAPGAAKAATPIELQALSEVQTVWMSAYEPRGGAAAY